MADPAPVARPSDSTRWRCSLCGNLTRFDVTTTRRAVEFVHVELSGEARVENTEVLEETVEQVRCRWCNAEDSIELVERPGAGSESSTA
ncbi:hypothetical protein BIV57_20615 [Mangrovactinospora gilvigrisea]|uniref:Uncharacterized protein n=1 Tax=Mangrovactinospora gilvigrisea TaxID=1428644 RepID=A0A1J7BAG5_9ACTN|nr:hypothetical protein [Mangrovactinospora gilvigrisea]OIV35606.1 hypothetical protein BIV57_20615 [Mangrovactinospora gilvigrisea]